ncbi:MAG TPA: hypothetical protein DD381_10930 [Lentisphaeria bacterium]|nr:MAG: hypothetical protein A2X47_00670 [Lentisphaerae bacterium GWF2_38_69]HBM16841.1 hypothetical protein [Lentisphaeria bacterium]
MLLGIAVAFVSTSIIEKKATSNNMDINTARFMAYAAYQRAKESIINSNALYQDIYPVDTSRNLDDEERADLIANLETVITSSETTDTYIVTDTGITWSYQQSTDNEPNRWLSRLSYAAMADPDTPEAKEAFWIPSSASDTTIDDSELYHRFDLMNYTWDEATVTSFLGGDTINFDDNPGATTSTVIPWLKNWEDFGDMGSATAARNQIIANLIDYCDSDSAATTDYDGVTSPTYVGLEKCPYINEIVLKCYVYVSYVGSSSGGPGFRLRLYVTPSVEQVNLYDESASQKVEVDVTAMYTITFSWYSGSWPTCEESLAATSPDTTVTTNSKSYSASTMEEFYGATVSSVSDNIFFQVSSFRITNITVKLFDSSNNLQDYSIVLDSPVTCDEANVSGGFGHSATSPVFFLRYEANDSRQNLLSNDWTYSTTDSSLGSDNSNFNPNPGGDTDAEPTATHPWEISTAYIADTNMQSAAELGYIHRAKAFQTINLKTFNDTEGLLDTAGGNAYADGDANILDQVKLDTDISRNEYINLNSRDRYLFSSLTELYGEGISTETAVSALNIARPLALYQSRASILANSDLADVPLELSSILYPVQETDTEREQVIGDVITGCEAMNQSYFIIGLGESFRDVVNYKQYDADIDIVSSSQKVLTKMQKTIGSDSSKVVEFQYLSD